MNKHLKCALKLPITVALFPFAFLVFVFVFLPSMVIEAFLIMSGCMDTASLTDRALDAFFDMIDAWRGL